MSRERARSVGLDVLGSAVLALVAFRCFVLIAPRRFFDVDPALDPSPLTGLGPTGSLVVDLLLLLVSAAIFALAGAPSWRVVGLAVLPLPWCLGHAMSGNGVLDAQLGVAWGSAVIAGLAIHVLAGDPRRRRVLLALLFMSLGPLAARAALQMEIPALGYSGAEFTATVAEFERNQAQLLADRGWAPESSAALIFERRVRQAQPSGWFVTTNLLATLAAAGALGAAAIACGLWRDRASRAAAVGMVVVALMAAVILWSTGSRGAIGAAGVSAIAVLGAAVWRGRPGFARGAIVMVPVLVLAGVFVRGHVLPESFAGELSVLFRSQYLDGAAAVVRDAPFTGVGPAGFQDAYVAHRPARSPEEVASAHNAWADWVTAFGVAGAAWIILGLAGLARAVPGREPALPNASAPDDDHVDGELIGFRDLACPLVAVLVAIVIELPALPSSTLTVRGIGLALGGFLAILAARALASSSDRTVGFATLVMALVFAAHAQLDMSWSRPGPATWGWILLALAAPHVSTAPRVRRASVMLAGGTAGLALVVMFVALIPAMRTAHTLERAATTLAPVAELRRLAAQVNAGDRGALPELTQRVRALGGSEQDLTNDGYPRFMRRVEATARSTAARVLLEAETDDTARLAAREAAMAITVGADPALADPVVHALHPAVTAGVPAAAAALHRLERACGRDGVSAAQRLVELDPNGLSAWEVYAAALWEAGQRAEAAIAYQRVLEIDEDFELDPLKQLNDHDRSVARERAVTE